MTSHRRVKDIDYDEDDLYSEDEGQYDDEEPGYTAEDKQNFSDLTPVVRAHLDEAGVQASNRQIEEALWHYYWDVAKSVEYLKTQQMPKQVSQQTAATTKKAKSKFDEAAEKNASRVPGKSLLSMSLAHLTSLEAGHRQRISTDAW